MNVCVNSNDMISIFFFNWKLKISSLLTKIHIGRSHNRGWRPQARANSTIGAVPMIWDNFSIFRTNCAIACSTREHLLRGFLCMSRGGNDVRNPPNVWCFWSITAHNPIRSCLLEFYFRSFVITCSSLSEVLTTVLNIVMSCFIINQIIFRCFFYKSSTLLHFKFHISWRITAFP